MKKIIILVLTILMISSCGINNKEKEIISNQDSKTNISFENPKNDLEKLINNLESNLSDDKNSKINLVKAYLEYGNSYYKENTFANKTLDILNTLEEDFIVEYLKGYAYEIQTEYDKAIIQYDKALLYTNISIEDKVNAINQKGHIFDLKGDMKEANKYYLEAELLDPNNVKTLVNRGRYEIRIYNYETSKEYFEKVLEKTTNKYLRSEMYYNLSIIYKDDYEIDKAIENAKLGIEENKDYPNNYLSIGNLYIIKGGDEIGKAVENLEKSIELYPNSSISYKFLGIYYYKLDDYDKAIKNFIKQVELSEKDILLMADAKLTTKIAGEYDLARTYALKGDVINSVKYLKKVLNGKNTSYYKWFLLDSVDNNGDFKKISNEDLYKNEVKNILIKYNKN